MRTIEIKDRAVFLAKALDTSAVVIIARFGAGRVQLNPDGTMTHQRVVVCHYELPVTDNGRGSCWVYREYWPVGLDDVARPARPLYNELPLTAEDEEPL